MSEEESKPIVVSQSIEGQAITSGISYLAKQPFTNVLLSMLVGVAVYVIVVQWPQFIDKIQDGYDKNAVKHVEAMKATGESNVRAMKEAADAFDKANDRAYKLLDHSSK